MRVWVFAALTAAVAMSAPSAQAADQGSLRVTGAKQGVITVDGKGLEVVDFDYVVDAPTDPASGLPTGKRMHKPVTFMVPWSAASPQLFAAAVGNETLTSVEFTNSGPNVQGVTKARFSLQLTNARIVEFKVADKNGKDPSIDPVVTVSFTFQKIAITDVTGGKTAMDDWEAR